MHSERPWFFFKAMCGSTFYCTKLTEHGLMMVWLLILEFFLNILSVLASLVVFSRLCSLNRVLLNLRLKALRPHSIYSLSSMNTTFRAFYPARSRTGRKPQSISIAGFLPLRAECAVVQVGGPSNQLQAGFWFGQHLLCTERWRRASLSFVARVCVRAGVFESSRECMWSVESRRWISKSKSNGGTITCFFGEAGGGCLLPQRLAFLGCVSFRSGIRTGRAAKRQMECNRETKRFHSAVKGTTLVSQ